MLNKFMALTATCAAATVALAQSNLPLNYSYDCPQGYVLREVGGMLECHLVSTANGVLVTDPAPWPTELSGPISQPSASTVSEALVVSTPPEPTIPIGPPPSVADPAPEGGFDLLGQNSLLYVLGASAALAASAGAWYFWDQAQQEEADQTFCDENPGDATCL